MYTRIFQQEEMIHFSSDEKWYNSYEEMLCAIYTHMIYYNIYKTHEEVTAAVAAVTTALPPRAFSFGETRMRKNFELQNSTSWKLATQKINIFCFVHCVWIKGVVYMVGGYSLHDKWYRKSRLLFHSIAYAHLNHGIVNHNGNHFRLLFLWLCVCANTCMHLKLYQSSSTIKTIAMKWKKGLVILLVMVI